MRPPRQPKTKAELDVQGYATLACDADLSSLRAGDGDKPLSKAQRQELLKQSRAGEVVELVIDATVFRQSNTPRPLSQKLAKEANANFSTFRERDLPALARSFKGRPLLKDHDRNDFDAAGGEILASSHEQVGDWHEFHQTLKLVKPWLVESALDGTLKTFSISWDPKQRGFAGFRASAFCTVCNASMFSSDCMHFPGDVVELEDEDGETQSAVVELEWRSVRGAETSAVSFPAVEGTAVEEIRAALSEARGAQPTTVEVDTMAEEKKDEAKEVADLKAKLAEAHESLAAERAEHAREAKERHTADVVALREQALGAGLFVPGDGLDESFGHLSAIGLDKAQAFVDSLKPRVPVGASMQSTAAPATPAAEQGKLATLCTDEYEMDASVASRMPKILKGLGLTEDDFEKHGQHNRWKEAN